MSAPRPHFLSKRQWWQIRAMRFGLWFLTVQAVLVGGGCGVYIASVLATDRRRAHLRMPPPLSRR